MVWSGALYFAKYLVRTCMVLTLSSLHVKVYHIPILCTGEWAGVSRTRKLWPWFTYTASSCLKKSYFHQFCLLTFPLQQNAVEEEEGNKETSLLPSSIGSSHHHHNNHLHFTKVNSRHQIQKAAAEGLPKYWTVTFQHTHQYWRNDYYLVPLPYLHAL